MAWVRNAVIGMGKVARGEEVVSVWGVTERARSQRLSDTVRA